MPLAHAELLGQQQGGVRAFFAEDHGNDAENFFEQISSLETVPRTLFD
jgi:hypothetical protein